MSGGSMEYCFLQIAEASEKTDNPIIRKLLLDVADVLHDEEWWKSSDICRSDYEKTLAKFGHKWLRKKWREGDGRKEDKK